MAAPLYLLDTNVLFALIRGKELGERIEDLLPSRSDNLQTVSIRGLPRRDMGDRRI